LLTAGTDFVATALPSTTDLLETFGVRAGVDAELEDRGFCRAGPACADDFDDSPDDELFDADDPFVPADPVESADATAGTEAIAAPTPRATAEAPTQVNILRWPGVCCFGAVIPPNSAGNIRSPWDSDSNRSVERIAATPR
jgi:hypothetical protein